MITKYTTGDEVWVPMRITCAREINRGEIIYYLEDPIGNETAAVIREKDIIETAVRREFKNSDG